MTSEKQIQANRRSALKSTGPETAAEKATVRHNSLKHGLLSQVVLLPNEDEGESGKSFHREFGVLYGAVC